MNPLQAPPKTWLEHPDGRLAIEELPDGRRRWQVCARPGVTVLRGEGVTSYPVDLIARILEVKTLSYVGDEIAREQDPNYVARFLRWALLPYVSQDVVDGRRLLDFGSGAGASTVILARMFPRSEIVGVELRDDFIDIARRRTELFGITNVTFHRSPDPRTLPPDLGAFDFVNLGAVYEHLLPDERPRLLAQLFSRLHEEGVFFVNQVPFRFYPVEAHTTGLPLLNYLPDRLACRAANRYSPRIRPRQTWPELLRNGVRGGTARSVKYDLQSGGGTAVGLTPHRLGVRDHSDLWFRDSWEGRPRAIKQVMRLAFKAIERTTGEPFAPGLALAYQKRN